MYPALLAVATTLHVRASCALHRLHRAQRGEGVISAAIAVLVMAFLGVAMWVAFKGLFASTTEKTGHQVSQIGN